jgi:hypothetical protein
MRRSLLAAAIGFLAAPALAADVGVSVSVGQPGFFGRIDIGNLAPPQLVYPQPVVVERPPAAVAQQPVYLYVPPEHAKDWRKHCREYNACAQPVYFVQQGWYDNVYVPHYRAAYAPQQALAARNIRSDVVRANVIHAHDIHAESVHARVIHKVKDQKGGGRGSDIQAPMVQAEEIEAHDIHARVVEADTLYVHELHTSR